MLTFASSGRRYLVITPVAGSLAQVRRSDDGRHAALRCYLVIAPVAMMGAMQLSGAAIVSIGVMPGVIIALAVTLAIALTLTCILTPNP